MEGIIGVVNWDDVTVGGSDHGLFRRIMTQEVNAAIESALASGATEIVVRDAHDSGRNVLPDLLNPGVKLLRDWSYGPLSMMEGIDKSFEGVIFIGHYARASTPNAVLKHTIRISSPSSSPLPIRLRSPSPKRRGPRKPHGFRARPARTSTP